MFHGHDLSDPPALSLLRSLPGSSSPTPSSVGSQFKLRLRRKRHEMLREPLYEDVVRGLRQTEAHQNLLTFRENRDGIARSLAAMRQASCRAKWRPLLKLLAPKSGQAGGVLPEFDGYVRFPWAATKPAKQKALNGGCGVLWSSAVPQNVRIPVSTHYF